MAPRQCQAEGHVNLGRSILTYVRLSLGEVQNRYRLRFCPRHNAAVQEDLSQFKVDPDSGALSGGDALMTQCFSCRQPIGESDWYLYVTSYPTKNEREDYWSRLHVNCSIGPLLERGSYAENC